VLLGLEAFCGIPSYLWIVSQSPTLGYAFWTGTPFVILQRVVVILIDLFSSSMPCLDGFSLSRFSCLSPTTLRRFGAPSVARSIWWCVLAPRLYPLVDFPPSFFPAPALTFVVYGQRRSIQKTNVSCPTPILFHFSLFHREISRHLNLFPLPYTVRSLNSPNLKSNRPAAGIIIVPAAPVSPFFLFFLSFSRAS